MKRRVRKVDKVKLNKKEQAMVIADIDERMNRMVKDFQWQYDSLHRMKKKILEKGEYP